MQLLLLLLLLLLRVLRSYTMIDHGYRFICGFIYCTNAKGVGMTSDFREGEPVWFTIGTVFMSGLHH